MGDSKFERGPAKRQLTLQVAEDLGARGFMMRLHIFTKSRYKSSVIDDLGPKLKALLDRDSFPTLSYELWHPEHQQKYSKLYAPANPAKRFGLFVLGLVNTIALPIATKALVISSTRSSTSLPSGSST